MPQLAKGPSCYDFHRRSLSSISELTSYREGHTAVGRPLTIPERARSPAISEVSVEERKDSTDASAHRQTYLDLIGKRDTPFITGIAGTGEETVPISPMESKTRAQYFEEQFQYKDQVSAFRERVQSESPVVAELRTNVIVKDEYTLVTDMSYHFSNRYVRPESSIMINVDHSACLLLAGSFEPAYILTIHALPTQVQPTTNKRNAALIQAFMADVLSVPPERGIIRFQAIASEDLATNGTTMLGAIERLEKAQSDDQSSPTTISRAFSRAASRKSLGAKPRGINTSLVPEPLAPKSPSTQQTPLTNGNHYTSMSSDQDAVPDTFALLSLPSTQSLEALPNPSRFSSPPHLPAVFELPTEYSNNERPTTSAGSSYSNAPKDSKRNSRSSPMPNVITTNGLNGNPPPNKSNHSANGIDWRPQTPRNDRDKDAISASSQIDREREEEKELKKRPSFMRGLTNGSGSAKENNNSEGVREIIVDVNGGYVSVNEHGAKNGKASSRGGVGGENNTGSAAAKGVLKPPPVPEDTKTVKLGKRKSLLAVFRR